MTWKQSTGQMFDAGGSVIATGYAGNGPDLNNPDSQAIHARGPLPQGNYAIGPLQASHGTLGTNVAFLEPDPANEMFGRSGFFMHGRKSPADMDASDGCIVIDHDARLAILNGIDRRLQVIS